MLGNPSEVTGDGRFISLSILLKLLCHYRHLSAPTIALTASEVGLVISVAREDINYIA